MLITLNINNENELADLNKYVAPLGLTAVRLLVYAEKPVDQKSSKPATVLVAMFDNRNNNAHIKNIDAKDLAQNNVLSPAAPAVRNTLIKALQTIATDPLTTKLKQCEFYCGNVIMSFAKPNKKKKEQLLYIANHHYPTFRLQQNILAANDLPLLSDSIKNTELMCKQLV